jgi:mono/diheme cytochrome c family protein
MNHHRQRRRWTVPVVLIGIALAASSLLGDATRPAAGQPDQARGAESGDVEAGERVFRTNCAMCHGSDAAGMMGMHPSLHGATERLSPAGVEVAIREGRATEPPMPAWEGRLSDREIEDVMAYIASLPDGPRNFGPGSDGDGMMMMDGGNGGWPMLAVVVVVVAIGGGVAWRVWGRSGRASRVLDSRYAAGEISRDEYLQRRDDLRR